MQVEYFRYRNKENPVKRFIDSLSIKQKTKVFRIFLYIEKYGLTSILPHVKKIKNSQLWEIRILGKDNIRIIYVVPLPKRVLLLHGFIKKTNKTLTKDLNLALLRLKQWRSYIDK